MSLDYHFVSVLPDLIQPDEYSSDPEGKRVRMRLRVTHDGIEILGDAATPKSLEDLLEQLGAVFIEQMLCG